MTTSDFVARVIRESNSSKMEGRVARDRSQNPRSNPDEAYALAVSGNTIIPELIRPARASHPCSESARVSMAKTSDDKPRQYRKRPSQFVLAVQLAVDTEGFKYRKWGGLQRAKRGDWLVDNDGDVYTVDDRSFRRTYRRLSPGVYLKKTPVWAREAKTTGKVATKEGHTRYKRGDYVVSNHRDGRDSYAVSRAAFRRMYAPATSRSRG
jgi:hypothetical protein